MGNTEQLDILYHAMKAKLRDEFPTIYDDDQTTPVGELYGIKLDDSCPEHRRLIGYIQYHSGELDEVALYCENAQEKENQENG